MRKSALGLYISKNMAGIDRRTFIRTLPPLLAGITVPRKVISKVKKSSAKINLLFIMTDQQRCDTIAYGGNPIIKTPNLDCLAKEGAYFENAYSNCPICVPARVVILTGHSTHSSGVKGNNERKKKDLPDLPTFDSILSENRYHTEYYGKWHAPKKFTSTYKYIKENLGLSEAGTFREYLDKHVPARPVKDNELLDKRTRRPYTPIPLDSRYGFVSKKSGKKGEKKHSQSGTYGRLNIPAEHCQAAFTAKETLQAIEKCRNNQPFSITCSIDPPHPPMVIPEPYFSMYDPEKIPVPESINDKFDNAPYTIKEKYTKSNPYRIAKNIRQMTSIYYGMVSNLDFWIGRILDELKRLNLEKNTLVIFTSDHGEMLGDHGMHGKVKMYEGSAHIPLIMRLPGVIPDGVRISTPVSHVDIFSTILDYLDMPEHPSEGRSLKTLIDKGKDPVDYCVSEWKEASPVMIRIKNWKLILYMPRKRSKGKTNALYFLKADPHEMNNLIGRNPEKKKYSKIFEAIKKRLVKRCEKINHPCLESIKKIKI